MSPIVTLTTDFGMRDSYVAQVKGVLLSLGPKDLRVVDLAHEIAPQDVREGAFFLRSIRGAFPRGTIHLAVVDPGVGSARRPIAIESFGQFWVGPDNGLLGFVLEPQARVHRIVPSGGEPASATFHARDVFAPAAARLAHGEPIAGLGPPIGDAVTLAWPAPVCGPDGVDGEIVHVDRYGNLISNLERAHLPGGPVHVMVEERVLRPIRTHYAEAARGELIALFGSGGLLEIAARDASAAALLGVGVGAPVRVERVWGEPTPPAG